MATKNDLVTLVTQKGGLTSEELAKETGISRKEINKRLRELRQKKQVASYTHKGKTHHVSYKNYAKSADEAVELLPTEAVYNIAQYLFNGRDFRKVSHLTRVDETLVKGVEAHLKKQKVTKNKLHEHLPLAESDQKVYDHLQEHSHGSRMDIAKATGLSPSLIRDSLRRVSYFTDRNHDF